MTRCVSRDAVVNILINLWVCFHVSSLKARSVHIKNVTEINFDKEVNYYSTSMRCRYPVLVAIGHPGFVFHFDDSFCESESNSDLWSSWSFIFEKEYRLRERARHFGWGRIQDIFPPGTTLGTGRRFHFHFLFPAFSFSLLFPHLFSLRANPLQLWTITLGFFSRKQIKLDFSLFSKLHKKIQRKLCFCQINKKLQKCVVPMMIVFLIVCTTTCQ